MKRDRMDSLIEYTILVSIFANVVHTIFFFVFSLDCRKCECRKAIQLIGYSERVQKQNVLFSIFMVQRNYDRAHAYALSDLCPNARIFQDNHSS